MSGAQTCNGFASRARQCKSIWIGYPHESQLMTRSATARQVTSHTLFTLMAQLLGPSRKKPELQPGLGWQ
eukprot:1209752-Amphidinium_carterae.1